MQKYQLRDLIEFDDKKFSPKVLINEPGYRAVLLSLRRVNPFRSTRNPERVTVHAIGVNPANWHAGEVVCIESGSRHRLEAHEDSALFVIAAGKGSTPRKEAEELDLREVPRPERHPLVFEKLDASAVGESFILINDHDPVPLSRQIEDKRPGQVTWAYEQRGTGTFRIRRGAAADTSVVPVENAVRGSTDRAESSIAA